MAVNMLLVKSYATNVYLGGTTTFASIEATRPEYVEPVKQHAADSFYIDDINRALTMGFINPQEHADTLAMKTETSPQYRPQSLSVDEQI